MEEHLAALEPILTAIQGAGMRIGQALEIAVYRALSASNSTLLTLGGFPELGSQADNVLQKKEEPPSLLGGRVCKGKLDFLVLDRATSLAAGVEVKNIREWVYPGNADLREFLLKCCALDVVPILVARRIHFNTTRLLIPRGGLVHESFFQRYPISEAALAGRAADKYLLGFHDIRVGNEPDPKLLRFVERLPELIPQARKKFVEGAEELRRFALGQATLRDLGLDY